MTKQFGRWHVLGSAQSRKSGRVTFEYVVARCECGTEREVNLANLLSGRSKSCGCWKNDHPSRVTHDMSNSPEYSAWSGIKKRCFNPRYHEYHLYGGRGISMCEEWKHSFEAFYRDMGPRPSGHSIDRIDNNRGYEKSNCRWAPPLHQTENRRCTILYDFNGEKRTLKYISMQTGTDYYKLYHQVVRKGVPLPDVLSSL